MTTTAPLPGTRDSSQRLLDSAAALSYDPSTEVDWDAPLDPDHFGLNPEWSTLYGTELWEEMTHAQRVTLTRHEVASIMSTGIWFEMILQQMVLRDQYCSDYAEPDFQFALTEIADECRHSIMFARACSTMGIGAYFPRRASIALGRGFKSVAAAEVAYGGILVAEEVLDVMQRDWMRGEQVLPIVRTTSKIHVVEESRHMKFARQEMRERIEGASPRRRRLSALVIAVAAQQIVSNMVNEGVYAAAGLDPARAVAAAKANEHHHTLMRSSCAHLMEFLDELGLLTRPALRIYQRVSMV
ncbi:AurF N-oxygenase family protein [Nocardioides sp. AX2bis]|uniref:AurF N-oxygenase family protein n=1 Tax=Nocardioides sp. AX2bis TaxID=2653157 RepID=UPI0012F3EF24|nr:diiron oxygenase [Nocardioides sp. AX2bis]VXC41404.1 p-aminobenzoate N-oxygenase AurF [Nocardioides sp. AX2bis]